MSLGVADIRSLLRSSLIDTVSARNKVRGNERMTNRQESINILGSNGVSIGPELAGLDGTIG